MQQQHNKQQQLHAAADAAAQAAADAAASAAAQAAAAQQASMPIEITPDNSEIFDSSSNSLDVDILNNSYYFYKKLEK